MPVPSSIDDLSQTAGSNSPAGSENPNTADDYLRTYAAYIATLRDGKGHSDEVQVASAATADIGSANSLFVEITGTTTITSFGTTYNGPRFVRFSGALTLTHNATSLIIPGGANVTTEAGDCAIAIPNGGSPSGWRVVLYQRASGAPIPGVLPISQGGTGQNTASAAFNAIKQSATDSVSGAVELATTTEAQTGTDTARAVTPAGLGAVSLGLNQTWQDFSGSRSLGTTYTNSTGRPICVSATITGSGAGVCSAILNVSGVTVCQAITTESNGTSWNGVGTPFQAVIPPGATYSISNNTLTNVVTRWSELR